ncbi:tetratricopeptide repeat domain 5 [Trypanosoma theileri]|uniref:Tetratricopeptide repeat domain 5 n=1 Tax=Trypanosoma theileri TaxID=67003 RepID=A0A1X0P1J7_9TRYP|nr:tetratricopeptide repeat domain 5 [Trypanosoma theileri]ORC90708.1 tetratricopeptide repeat domain 5 [Trypanosoma theileri]
MNDTIGELESKLDELTRIKVFDDDVRSGVDSLLESMPNPDEERDPDRRIRLLVLRCKALTLLPVFSMEAERDCSAALKLRHDRPDLWVLLSECLARRRATREACDALDHALRLDAANVEALCQYSRLLRGLSADPQVPAGERQRHLLEAVARGKAAASAAPGCADGWHSYAIALLSAALADGVDLAGVRRAALAMRQAATLASSDPDVRFNKAAIEGLLGHFGTAACDLLAAHEADPRRLPGTLRLLEDHIAILRRARSRIDSAQQTGKRAFAALLAKLPTPAEGATTRNLLEGQTMPTCRITVGVVDVLSESTMEPMVVLAAEKSGEFVLLLFYGLQRNAIKINDTIITLSFPGSTVLRVQHDVPAVPLLDSSSFESTYTQVFVDLKTTLVNGSPIPARMLLPPRISSRLFV